MNQTEHNLYWKPARLNFQDGPNDGRIDETSNMFKASEKLATVVGVPYPYVHAWDKIELTAELKEKLIILAGPHWHALAKTMIVKRKSECA